MTCQQRVELILNKIKDKGIEVGRVVPDKKQINKGVYELIYIAN